MGENFEIEENKQTKSKEEKSSRHSHGEHHSSHHGSHHGSHHSSHHSSDKSRHHHHDSQQRVVRDNYRKIKMEKVYKPILRVALFTVILGIFALLVWSVFNPSQEVKDAAERNKNVTASTVEEVRISELRAEIEALNAEIDEYKEKITELESKLEAIEAGRAGSAEGDPDTAE